MSYKFMFVLNALLAVVVGVAFLFVPGQSLGFFRAEQYAATLLMGRFFGSAMIALGLVLWFVKDANDEGVQKGVVISLLISAVLGLIVNILGLSGGVVRVNGWITIIVYVLFALGYGFLLFLKPRMRE